MIYERKFKAKFDWIFDSRAYIGTYHDTIQIIFKSIEDENSSTTLDSVLIPLMFLIRHSIELSLKYNINKLNIISEHPIPIKPKNNPNNKQEYLDNFVIKGHDIEILYKKNNPNNKQEYLDNFVIKGHDIKKLYEKYTKILEYLDDEYYKENKDTMDSFINLLINLGDKQNGTGFRYYTNYNKESNKRALNHEIYIDYYSDIKDKYNILWTNLNFTLDVYQDYIDGVKDNMPHKEFWKLHLPTR